ncbi:hypothetical protein B9T25_01605 [Acinetobacter sp. ANC 4470]|uniref:YdcF family protein n=1 Tax=Acinetobacter sp. ANC 4470 TaxID=1977881 RepID=UPI000A33EB8A|nr:YdcF family protein [Acinetobacter sp. ANC 4470]OTG69314.1 hypothetical protein B9T25_01605 [Acinetobacter sp. ANC 4470]
MSEKIKKIFSLILGCILFGDGLFLILQNKIHLGTLLPLLLGLILLIHAIFYRSIQCFLAQKVQFKTLYQWVWSGFLLWLITLAIFFAYIHQHTQQQNTEQTVQAIIILGSGIQNGQPSPTLAKRLDQGAELAQQQTKAILIVTGGIGYTEKETEAEIMAKYLYQQYNIPLQRIYLEDKSTSTELNLFNAKTILKYQNIPLSAPIAIVTSDFHTLRAAAIAKKLGYQNIITIGAKTPLTTRYNAWLREYFAFISGWILQEY